MGDLRADRSWGGRATRGSKRRVAWLIALAAGPVAALACSDDENKGQSAPDPGGTFGAEISVEVRGRGRVTGSLPGIDCPSTCFAKYVYPPGTSTPGAVTLKATPTQGANFRGWTFQTEPIPSRGRGPDNCNPVLRPASNPGASSGLEVTLPYGEVAGTPPPGQEASCNGLTTVPFVYKVIAEFDPTIDAGRDAGDTIEIVYEPVTGASPFSARDVGLVQGSTLYWHSTATIGGEIIARGELPRAGTSQAPVTVTTTSSSINLFEVDRAGVVYQTSSLGLFVIRGVAGTPETVNTGGTITCSTVSLDSSANLYCKTSTGTLVTWAAPYTAAPTVLYSGLTTVTDLLVESPAGPIYVTTSGSGTGTVSSLAVTGNDGGTGTLTPLFSSRYNPRYLESNADRFFWLDSSFVGVYASPGKTAGIASDTSVPSSSSFQYFAEDQSSTQYFWVAGSSSIYHAYYQGGALTKLYLGGLPSITGMTADTQYVYYTTTQDARVRRASRAGF
jgi:hypothetical protein